MVTSTLAVIIMVIVMEEEEDKSTLRLLYFTSSPTFFRVSGFVDMRSYVALHNFRFLSRLS